MFVIDVFVFGIFKKCVVLLFLLLSSVTCDLYFCFREVLSGRLNECIRLNEEYQRSFHRTKQKLRENPNERQFEFR